MTPYEAAIWLLRIARDLRNAGDVNLVLFDDDGVAPSDITLSDELELVALVVSSEACEAFARSTR